MNICIVVFTAFLCFHTTQTVASRDKTRICRTGKCRYKMNGRLRFLRDLSRSFYPENNIIDVRLKSLNNRKDGNFGTYDTEASVGTDIPKIVCPKSEDNVAMLPCPTPDKWSRIHCINYFSLCDRQIHCPNGEDEDPTMCMFHSANTQYMNRMMSAMSTLYRKTKEVATSISQPHYLSYSLEK